jgi:dihydroflavonol-4-reductase
MIKVPHGLILPIVYAAELAARLLGSGKPFVTVDGIKLARKSIFFTHARAECDLGLTTRPVDDALNDTIIWFRKRGFLPKR